METDFRSVNRFAPSEFYADGITSTKPAVATSRKAEYDLAVTKLSRRRPAGRVILERPAGPARLISCSVASHMRTTRVARSLALCVVRNAQCNATVSRGLSTSHDHVRSSGDCIANSVVERSTDSFAEEL